MMNIALHWITALSVLLHITLGCCAHHAHAHRHTQNDHCWNAVVEQQHHSHGHQHHHCDKKNSSDHQHHLESIDTASKDHTETTDPPHHQANCDEEDCVFALDEIDQFDMSARLLDFTIVEVAISIHCNLKSDKVQPVFVGFQSSLGKLRAHLFFCMMLI